jgi:3-oxoacyl-[acyl-carrier protein] reductase
MDLKIAGRDALVCGASKGLGFACALSLAREGAQVTLVSRSDAALEAACARISAETSMRTEAVAADPATPEGRADVLRYCPDPDILSRQSRNQTGNTIAGGPMAR